MNRKLIKIHSEWRERCTKYCMLHHLHVFEENTWLSSWFINIYSTCLTVTNWNREIYAEVSGNKRFSNWFPLKCDYVQLIFQNRKKKNENRKKRLLSFLFNSCQFKWMNAMNSVRNDCYLWPYRYQTRSTKSADTHEAIDARVECGCVRIRSGNHLPFSVIISHHTDLCNAHRLPM